MKQIILNILAVALVVHATSACSVGMAISGKPAPNLTNVKKGANRADIELALGPPVRTSIDSEGRDIAIYEYEVGNEPSAGRAVGHAVMDFLTFGIWEIVGTPIEAVQGDKYEITITYSDANEVMNMTSRKLASGQ